ncbi:MAG: hypothetical protein PHG27_01790 [Massilibacteroides sp.]|nr:hypothetical protein [Massilibacteroides sp.]MDD3061719.1 hypothetical protein [Massilibacteroides sp.]MDD4114318.1 hypothetical protein [Massilibacteroides sp.]MDD4660602.1 hypothetical protein [Massilibacteroides sp.]
MKDKEDIFSKFRDSFSKIDGRFHILEQRVPVELQMEYFKYSERIRKERGELTDIEYDTFVETLNDEETSTEYKRYVLSSLAASHQVRAYRALEKYVNHSSEDVTDWAYMALMESRISLESELSEEKQVYISTGLGGRGEKLRFYMMFPARKNVPFEAYQRQIIEREFPYNFEHEECEMERLTVHDIFVEIVVLVPVRLNIKNLLDKIINECNLYGNFLYDSYTITNVKELTEEEVRELLKKKNGDNQTSD